LADDYFHLADTPPLAAVFSHYATLAFAAEAAISFIIASCWLAFILIAFRH
jgi:hypothetical protein